MKVTKNFASAKRAIIKLLATGQLGGVIFEIHLNTENYDLRI